LPEIFFSTSRLSIAISCVKSLIWSFIFELTTEKWMEIMSRKIREKMKRVETYTSDDKDDPKSKRYTFFAKKVTYNLCNFCGVYSFFS